jgi:hypothetical protein
MRRFSVSIEDRILRMPDKDDTSKGPVPPKPKEMSSEERDAAYKKELESNDAVYEQMVRNIEKAKERFEIESAALDKMKSMSKLEQERLTLTESRLNQMRIEAQSLESLVEMAEKLGKFDEDAQNIAKERLQSLIDEYDLSAAIADEYKMTLASTENIKNLKDKIIGEDNKIKNFTLDEIKNLKEYLKLVSKDSEADKARVNALEQSQKKMDGVGQKILKNTGLTANASDTLLGGFSGMVAEASKLTGSDKGGVELLRKQLGKTIRSSLNFTNVLANAVEFAAKAALEISNLSRNLGTTTGFGDVFQKQMANIALSANMSGVDFKEAADAIGSMASNLSSFDAQAGRTNKEVGTTVAMLGKIGVKAGTSTKNIDHLQRSMGLSTEAAADMSAQIALMGRTVGITTSKMMSNFNALKTRIAEFGNVGMRVFKEMNALVKATGLEIDTLTTASKKFDTFDGAAESVGKMNSVLGTQLSTLEMLSATDSERIMLIKQQVQMSVGNFDSLDRYTKMYIAQAMGVETVDKAQKLLNMSTAEYNKYTKGQQESADIQKELADATAELVPMMQQLKLAGIQIFMVFKPIITVFSGIIKSISMLIGLVGKLFTGLSSIFGIDGSGGMWEAIIGLVMLAAIGYKVLGASIMTALGPIGWIALALTSLFGVFHLKGSPELWELPEHSSKGYESMANSMGVAAQAADATSASMKKVHNSMHKAGGKSFSIEAMAKLDTEKIAAGLTKVKSAMMELSTLKIDGFLAMSTDGAKSSIVMGSQGVIKSLSEGKLAIDVNMPEIALPPINVVVEVNGSGLNNLINARIEERGIRD